MKPRILLTGKNGQVGRELDRMLSGSSELRALGHQELDLTQPDCIRRAIREFHPHLMVNAAAYTAVDQAESEEPLAHSINAEAPAVMAEETQQCGAALVHYSTDYVFDGRKQGPYVESDAAHPLSAYGRTKLAGETAIRAVGGRYLIFRTEWVYATRGRNFLGTILRLAAEREELRVVSDQFGSPTWSREIARATANIIAREWQHAPGDGFLSSHRGVYHLTASGRTSWFHFASAIVARVRSAAHRAPWIARSIGDRPLKVRRILPISTEEYPTAARRPANSLLSNERLKRTFGVQLPDWRIQLETVLAMEDRD